MLRQARPTSNAVCSCGSELIWESRQSVNGTRWLALCANGECGEVVIPHVDGKDAPRGLEFFLLDGQPPAPYHPPWSRLFLQASEFVRWRPAYGCPDCGRAITFRMNLPITSSRTAEPYETVLCLDCGRVQISYWVPPGLHSTVMPGSAWETPATPILALQRAIRDRGRRTRSRHAR
jgi:hypothetical protein